MTIHLGAERAGTASRCVVNYRDMAALIDELTVFRMELPNSASPPNHSP